MYSELEKVLLKYIDQKLLLTKEQINEEEKLKSIRTSETSIILVISSSSDKLNKAKAIISEDYKGVYVHDEEQAEKYLAKHKVEFIMRET